MRTKVSLWRCSQACVAAILASLVISAAPQVAAQRYPAKSVRLVVPFPPGAGLDVVGRLMAQKLSETRGPSLVVDNRPGAAGTIGADIVAKAVPDGYTLVMGGIASHGTAKGLYPRLPYDPIKDFAPIMLIARAPSALLVHAALPVKTARELIANAKANPGKLNYSSSGSGSTGHLAVEMFKNMAGLDVVHVPFGGPTPGLTALAMGETQMAIQSQLSAQSLIRTGRIRMLATTGSSRLAKMPELPTVAESGAPGYEFYVWYGVLAPAGTPVDIVALLNRDFSRVFHLPDVRDRLLAQESELVISTPDAFRAFLDQEVAKWTKVIRDIGVRVE